MSWSLYIDDSNFNVITNFSSRFANDKANFESENYVVLLDGFLLNSAEIKKEYGCRIIAEALISAYEKKQECFINDLRGSFNGAIYDKRRKLWITFVNQYGDRPLFYCKDKEKVFISSNFNDVVHYLKCSGKSYKPNKTAAYYILTYGYMIDDSTHIEEIRRLMPGDYICIYDRKVTIKQYYRLDNTKIQNISFDDAVEKLDIEFKKAIKRIFDKDIEYGYKSHIADMSGGLDSRMVSWVAHDMGYNNITNINYAQSQSKEWKVALDVANALGNDFMYMPLDKCNFIYDIDEIIGLNYGLAIYAGITGGKRFLANLNNSIFGLEMTGQLGDVIIGSYINNKPIHTPPSFGFGTYSKKIKFNFEKSILDEFTNMELFTIYKRGFLGILSSHLIRNKYTDVASPFLDMDFLSFCLSLPLKYRYKHKLYNAWVARKYPQCASISTTKYDGPVKENMTIIKVKKAIKKGPAYVSKVFLNKIGINTKGSPVSMNPFDYWYMTDSNFQKFICKYFEDNKSRINSDSKLSKDIEEMFKKGFTLDKLLVLTLLATYKYYNLYDN